MQQKNIIVTNPSGLHTRPASELARLVKGFASQVKIHYMGKEIPVKSALSVMAACIGPGSSIDIVAEGEDEAECLCAVEAYLKELKE